MKEENQLRERSQYRDLVFLFPFILFALVTVLVSMGYTQPADDRILSWITAIRISGFNVVIEGITYFGNWESITLLCVLLLAFPKTRFSLGIPVAAVAIITTLIKALIKPLLARPRPPEILHLIDQGGFSFPSGHAITSIAVFLLIALALYQGRVLFKHGKLLFVLCICLAVSIGLSRIYLGVHYPSDVLGGWLAGLGSASLTLLLWEKVQLKFNLKP